MKNLTYKGFFDEPATHIHYQFYGHEKPTEAEMILGLTKKSLHENIGTRTINGLAYEIVRVTLADGWKDAQ